MNPEKEHFKDPEFIHSLFRSISPSYDKANDAITFGMARLWRSSLVKWSKCAEDARVLDCATGTGDLAFEFHRALGPKSKVLGIDFVAEMISIADQKSSKKTGVGLGSLEFQVADSMNLPFPDSEFDVASIAYGIRNVADPIVALSEMARVVRPGGVVMVLETGKVQNPVLGPFLRVYFEKWVPWVGGMLSGHRSAYEYLNQSSGAFPCGSEFLDWMKATKSFSKVEFRTLMGGASYLYKGTVGEKSNS